MFILIPDDVNALCAKFSVRYKYSVPYRGVRDAIILITFFLTFIESDTERILIDKLNDATLE